MIRGGNPPFGRKMLPGIEQGRILYGDIPTLPTHTSHEFTPAFTSPNHTPHSHPRTTRHIHIPESHATFTSPHSRPHYPRTHTPHYPRIYPHTHTPHYPRITHTLPTHTHPALHTRLGEAGRCLKMRSISLFFWYILPTIKKRREGVRHQRHQRHLFCKSVHQTKTKTGSTQKNKNSKPAADLGSNVSGCLRCRGPNGRRGMGGRHTPLPRSLMGRGLDENGWLRGGVWQVSENAFCHLVILGNITYY